LNRREFATRLAAASAMLPLVDFARAQGGTPTEGAEYVKLSPPVAVTPPPGKVEVVEFFTYACPHCFEFEPTLEAWRKQPSPDVYFHRVPVPFLFNYEYFQPIYYTLEAMGLVEAMQLKVFNAVHLEHQRLDKPEDIAAFMKKNGIDPVKFMSIFNSFSVRVKVQQVKHLIEMYQIDQVPMLAVQGRFITSPGHAKGGAQALQVVDYLTQRIKSGR